MRSVIDQLKDARRVSTPLVAIRTSDQYATLEAVVAALNGAPKFCWDAIRGLRALNEEAITALVPIGKPEQIAAKTGNPNAMLDFIQTLPPRSFVAMLNAHRFLGDAVTSTGIGNLRDLFKADTRMLLLLGPEFTLPVELQQSVVLLDEPTPDDQRLDTILGDLYIGMQNPPVLAPETRASAVAAGRGLSAFMAEQTYAMSLRKDTGIDLTDAWERKRSAIAQIKGLTLETDGPRFDDIAGLGQIRRRMEGVFAGANPPALVMRWEEVEKQMAGATGGDLSGTSGDAFGQLLTTMQDSRWTGFLAVGPGGSGKSLVSKAIARQFGVPGLNFDPNATKGRYVGDSEERIRILFKTVSGLAGGKPVMIVGTCNKLASLPPELRRRFKQGIWFFDLPTAAERDAIVILYLKKYGLWTEFDDAFADRTGALGAMFAGWTGAEIETAIETAANEDIPIEEAAKFVVPISTADPEGLAALRDLADGRFLSASSPGPYRRLGAERAPAGGRAMGAL